MRRGALAALALIAALCAAELAACAALPWPAASRAPSAARSGPEQWLDLRGVVHVHTSGSHDSSGTLADVVAAARSAGVAWVGITEHPEPGHVPDPGVYDGVVVIPGYELNAAHGTLLAIGVTARPPRRVSPAALVRWIHAERGVAFVGHFERSGLADVAAYLDAAADGIEIANLHAAALEQPVALALGLLAVPAPLALRVLLQTPEANLARWDALPSARAIVGGVDAHAKFRVLGPLGGTLDRYRDMFRLLTTHVLAREASPEAIVAALREGRSYVAFEGRAPVDRFVFRACGRAFEVRAPRSCRLSLVCDGAAGVWQQAAQARLAPPPDARQCRAEAWLDGRLWVVTSYQPVRGPDGSAPSSSGC